MTGRARRTSPGHRSRRAALLALSVAFHAAVLGGLSLGVMPAIGPRAEPGAVDVALVDAPPFVRPQLPAEPPKTTPPKARLAVLDTPPRYAKAAASAATGDAGDAVDLFGPVFADGLWPRPVLVKSEPCDPKDVTAVGQTCRRDLLLIGLASDAVAGSNPRP